MARKRRGRGKGGAGGPEVPALPLAQAQPRGAGQPTKLTPEAQRRIVAAIEEGASRKQAARAAAVGLSTLQLWLQKGAAGEPGIYLDFLDAVEGAEERLIQRAAKVMVGFLGETTSESVRFAAAKFVLERRAPERWGSRKEVAHTGPTGGPLQVEHSGQVATPLFTDEQIASMSPEQLQTVLKVELEARRARGT